MSERNKLTDRDLLFARPKKNINIESPESQPDQKDQKDQQNQQNQNQDWTLFNKLTTTKIDDSVEYRKFQDKIEPKTIIQTLDETVEKYRYRNAMYWEHDDSWKSCTWKQLYTTIKLIAMGFSSIGLKRGEGVAVLGFNAPRWVISNYAAIVAGGVSVGIYATNSAETCEYIINDANVSIIIVENKEQLNKILEIKDKLKNVKAIIQYDNEKQDNLPTDVYSWLTFYYKCKQITPIVQVDVDDIVMGEKFNFKHLDSIHKEIKPNQCASLIYTSGTTGPPKGVMLSHDNIIWTTKKILETYNIDGTNTIQKIVSYLPLSHIAGQMVDIYMPLVTGGEIWFADKGALKGTLIDTVKVAHPTIFLGVPRVWEKIKEKMQEKAKSASSIKKWLGGKAKEAGLERHNKLENGDHSTSLLWKFYNAIVFNKVKEALGLDKCKLFLTGAAPISEETLKYFASLNIPICDIYGMSECSGPMFITTLNSMRLGRSGKVVPDTMFKLAKTDNYNSTRKEGEICTYGRHVMMGYLNKPDKTKEAIDVDGWLHSGDIGKLDENGFLTITGRLKEILITEGGENIPPVLIENKIKGILNIISNCMLIGDKRKYLTMLITLKSKLDEDGNPTEYLDEDVINEFSFINSNITKISDAIKNENVLNYISNGIELYNKSAISRAQTIKKFRILPIDFSIGGGELGPTLKLKRGYVIQKYNDMIEEMYNN